MYCRNCGAEIPEGVKFCPKCGEKVEKTASAESNVQSTAETESKPEAPSYANPDSEMKEANTEGSKKKTSRAVPILNVIAGAILVIDGMGSIDYDFGLIAFIAGAGLLVMGILQLAKRTDRVVSIVEIVFGALTFIIGMMCADGFDWTYIAIFAGILILVTGILHLVQVSPRITAIVEIVLSVMLLILGLSCYRYIWGDTGIFVSIPFLVEGIMILMNLRKQNQQAQM